jgi:hypothetical protein
VKGGTERAIIASSDLTPASLHQPCQPDVSAAGGDLVCAAGSRNCLGGGQVCLFLYLFQRQRTNPFSREGRGAVSAFSPAEISAAAGLDMDPLGDVMRGRKKALLAE